MELTIGQKSKLLRKLRNLTQKTLASLCGCTPKQISILESTDDEKALSIDALKKLLEIFENTIIEFNSGNADLKSKNIKNEILKIIDTKATEADAEDILRLKMKYD